VPDETIRLAVLIDADNTSATHASAILEELARYGVPTVKRAYGDWTTQNLVRWKDQLVRHAIQPMQQFANTTGKNSTDSALIIDAMDLLYSGNLDAFAIVSSDSDFTRLATRLRESGKTVYGLGRHRTPTSLVAACNRFIYLEVLDRGAVAEALPAGGEDSSDSPDLPDLVPLLTSAIETTSADDGWVHLSTLGNYLPTTHASFDPRNYGYSKLSSLLREQPYLELDQREGHAARVRIKTSNERSGRAPRATRKAATKSPAEKS
jgi:uncharacterized protein (TIGR00288 family)